MCSFFLLDANAWTISDVVYIVIVGHRYYRESISLQTNPNTQEHNWEYLAVTDRQYFIYFKFVDFKFKYRIKKKLDKYDCTLRCV